MPTITEIIAAIAAAEQLMPALISFVNTVHPPTTSAPTKAESVLTTTTAALQVAGITAATVQAIQPALASASNSALGVTPAAQPVAAS